MATDVNGDEAGDHMTTIDTHRITDSTPIDDEVVEVVAAQTKPGWFDDPFGQHRWRYHDGSEWTTHVTHFGPSPCAGCR